jgi:small subunit ribosomal protein S1
MDEERDQSGPQQAEGQAAEDAPKPAEAEAGEAVGAETGTGAGAAAKEDPGAEAEPAAGEGVSEDERAEFLAALEQDFDTRESNRGEMVSGTVLSRTGEYLFVDLGGKSEGLLSLEEFRGEETPAVGDTVEACVISSGAGGVVLSRKLAKGIRDRELLEEAYRSKLPVEGRVAERNKGGFVVELAGMRAFCPVSQIELRYCEEPDVHLGQRYSFQITKYDDSGRRPDLVVSRKALLKAEAEREAAELRETLREGEIVSGTVRNIRDFGAFVDLGGLDGLLPISELSHARVDKVEDVLSIGDEVHVQVVSFDRERDRISLSLKRLEADPWEEAMRDFPEGSRVTGRVVRLQPFGAFVELTPGVDGLIHISNFNTPERISHPRAVVQVGDEIEVEVLSVEPERRRIGLARVAKPGEFGDVPVIGAVVEGRVDSVAPFGVFVKLGPGRKGLVPNAELGTPRGSDNRKDFRPDTPIKVKVLEVTDGGRRIRLSRQQALDDAERAEYSDYLDRDQGDRSGGFGTLGDLLGDKLKR